jgi:hypothetical protein
VPPDLSEFVDVIRITAASRFGILLVAYSKVLVAAWLPDRAPA